MKKKKANGFIRGVLSLMFSQIIVKILGMIYSLYLTNKQGFGDSGNAIYISSYQIYAIFLTISSIGIPNAVSKLVAESLSIGDVNGAKRVFRVSIAIFSLIGFICSVLLYVFSDFIAINLLEVEAGKDVLKILAPSIFFVSISAVIRGYFNGRENIHISAVAQSFEQVIKTILTIIIVEFVSRKTNFNTEIMAKAAMIAASVATIFSCIYIFKEYLLLEHKNVDFMLGISKFKKSAWQIFKNIIVIAIPISLASFIMILGKNIDSITIIRLLKNKIGEEVARERYGILSSKVELLTNFPMSLNGALSVALIPEIAKLNMLNDKKELSQKVNFSFFITMFLCIPIMIGMFLYSDEIINLLYPNSNKGGELLRIASLSIIFTTFTQTMTGILQGIGEVWSYLKIISISMIIKLILNLVLIPIDGIFEKGAIISSLVYDIIVFLFIFRKVKKRLDINIKIKLDGLRIFCITIISIIFSKFIMNNLDITNYNLKFIIEILIVVIIYFIFSLTFVLKNNNMNMKLNVMKKLKFKKN